MLSRRYVRSTVPPSTRERTLVVPSSERSWVSVLSRYGERSTLRVPPGSVSCSSSETIARLPFNSLVMSPSTSVKLVRKPLLDTKASTSASVRLVSVSVSISGLHMKAVPVHCSLSVPAQVGLLIANSVPTRLRPLPAV